YFRAPVAARDPRARARARASPAHARRGNEMALAAVREGERALNVLEDLELLDLAEAAAPGAGTARVPFEAPAVDANRRLEFHGLGRQIHAVRGIGLDRIDSVKTVTGTATSRQQLPRYEGAAILALTAKGHHQKLPGIGSGHPVGCGVGQRRE